MNGEHLPEYAALLNAEGLLGHQHANSGWGIFDDDNMVGATAFMETLELALELRRANYGANGEHLGFDLYPYTEDQGCGEALGDAVALHRRRRGQDRRGRAAGGAAAQGRGGGVRAGLRRARRNRLDAAPRRTRRRTSSVKGVAIDDAGAVLGVAESGYELSTPRPGWSEQNPDDWWRATTVVLDELDGGHADGIGLSGQMHGLVALDEKDRPLRPAILWNDGRTQSQCDEIEARVGLERLIGLTGNRALAGFTAPKLLWLREEEPKTYRQIRSILLPKDYVRLHLCGAHAIDVADASGTLLFDVAHRRWSSELLEELEIDEAWLPAVHESPDRVCETHGGVVVAAVRATRRRARSGSASSTRAARFGGARDLGCVFTALNAFAADPQARVHAFAHAVPDRWHAMGVMLSAAGSLSWLRNSAFGGGVPYDALFEEAAAWEPGVEGLRFAPYLAGERTPHADPDVRGAFTGLSLRHDRARSCVRCSRASPSGCATRWTSWPSWAACPRWGGCRAAARAPTSGSRSSPRCSTCRWSSPPWTRARRSARRCWAAWRAASSDVREAVEECVRVTRTIEPRPEWVASYAELLPAWRELYPLLKPLR